MSFEIKECDKTPRIGKLIDHLFAKMPQIEHYRAVLYTQSFRETEGEPIVLRKAKAFYNVCKNIPIVIRDNELIVGANSVSPRSCPTFPEFSFEWLESEFETVATIRLRSERRVKRRSEKCTPIGGARLPASWPRRIWRPKRAARSSTICLRPATIFTTAWGT